MKLTLGASGEPGANAYLDITYMFFSHQRERVLVAPAQNVSSLLRSEIASLTAVQLQVTEDRSIRRQ
jgi:hypothetical protein